MNTQLKHLPSFATPRFTKTFELLEEEEQDFKLPDLDIYSNTTAMNAPTGIDSCSIRSKEDSREIPSLIEQESSAEEPLEYNLCPHPQELLLCQEEEDESSQEIPVLSGKLDTFHQNSPNEPIQPQECETPQQFTFAYLNEELVCRSGSASTKAPGSPEQRHSVRCEEPEIYQPKQAKSKILQESSPSSPSFRSSRRSSRRQSIIREKELSDGSFLCQSPQRRLSHYGMNCDDLCRRVGNKLGRSVMKKESSKSPQICYSSGDSHYHSALGPSQLSLVDSYNREQGL